MISYEEYTKNHIVQETAANIDSPLVKEETAKIILEDIDINLKGLNDELFNIYKAVDADIDFKPPEEPKQPDKSLIETLRRIREEASFAVKQATAIRERLW